MADKKAPYSERLQGKVAIITGGARGIGEATARLFARHGPRVIIIADVQDDLGNHVAASIGLHVCTYIHCDVTDETQVKALIDQAVKNYGRLDIMFSNAGIIYPQQTVLDLDLNDFDRLMAVNARGMAACVKQAGRAMVELGVKGSIVCTASAVASVGTSVHVDYTMSKHAVLGLVRSASVQLGEYGIRVNCVSPSGLGTPMMCEAYGTDAESIEKMCGDYCSLKGVPLRAEHVADAVLFLSSDESVLVTGHNLGVDAGFPRGKL